MPIDFSKINLSVLPKGGNVVKSPSRTKAPLGGRIDYGAIKLGNIYTATKTTPKPVAPVKSSASFIGRPLVTPVEQQRMKVAATPIPETKMTALSATSVRAPKFGEVPSAKFNEWFMSPGPNVPKNSKGQPVVPVRNLPFGDENPHLDWERTTDPGGNKVFLAPWNDPAVKNDAINKMSYSAGGILTGIVMFLSAIVANSLGTRKAVKELSQQEQQLAEETGLGQQSAKQLKQSTSAYQYTEDLPAAHASTQLAGRQLGYINQHIDSAMKQFSDDELRGLVARAGWSMTGDEVNTMISNMRVATSLPKMSAISTDAITSFVSSTLKESGTKIGGMTQLLLALGEAQPLPALTNILGPLLATRHPTQAIADNVEKDATTFFQGLRSEINTGSWQRLAVPIGQPTAGANTTTALAVFQPSTRQAGNVVVSTAPVVPVSTAAPQVAPPPAAQVATEPYVSRDKFQVEHPLLERPQPAVPGVKTTKSMDQIMAEEEAAGRKLETTPRAVDKTIPAIDVKKANLVDVTAKVDLQSVQVKFPSADKVVLDTKRRTVMFMHGTTPLEAIGADKPQLNEWYGIDGTKLLGEVTRPVPVVAQVAPTAPPLSKMGTTEAIDMAARKVADAAQLKSPAYIRDKKITDDMAKRGLMRGSSLTGNPDLKEATQVWQNSYDGEVNRLTSAPDLSTTPQKGTATTISNQKTSIDTTPPVSLQGGTATGAGAVKWGKWIEAVGTRRTSGVGTGQVDTVKTPTTYRLGSGEVTVRTYAPEVTADRGISGPFLPDHGKILEIKGNSRSYYLLHRGAEGHRADYAYVVIESRSGGMMGHGTNAHAAISNAQEIINAHTSDFDTIIEKSVQDHGELANVTNSPFAVTKKILPAAGMTMTDVSTGEPLTIAFVRKDGVFYETKDGTAGMANPHEIGTRYQLQPMTSTSAPAGVPSLGNAAPAHGLIDYSKIELNGTTSVTSPAVLKSVSNTGKGFDNYIQDTPGTTNTSHSLATKFKEERDGFFRFISNEYNWFFKSPLGGEWMTIAVAADDLMLEEYKNPFYITEAGERVFVGGEFGPAILARYLKQFGAVKNRYLQDLNGIDLVDSNGKKISNPNYGKADFGIFLQHLQRAGIPIEATKGLGADKTNLAQQHIWDARDKIVNFQKNDPQLFTAYMAAADELGKANTLLAEFYKGIISPETYANDKANPHYYVSLSAGKTDIFDRSGVAPLERAHGLTNLDEVVAPLQGLLDVYVVAIRAQGINRAKIEMVKWNKNSEVATTVLSDSIVHLWENGVDRAYEVHDKDAGASIRNLTRSKWEVPSWIKRVLTAPTTLLRVFATGVNIAFGAFNPVRDVIQAAGLVPFTLTGLVKGAVKAFESPGLSQWSKDYRDPTRATGTKVTEAVKKIVELVSIPSNVGESLSRDVIAESIGDRGGTYLDQFYGYHAGTGFFALHGTVFNDFISSLVPFTRATIAVVRAAYRNAFYGLPIGGKGGTFSGKQGAEKILGKNFLATIIFAMIEIAAIKAAGKEKEYRLLRNRASFFYLYQPSGNWVKLPVPIGSAPVKAIVDSLYGFESDPMDVAGQTLNVIPGLEAFMLPPALTLYLQYKFNINFFTGSPINTGADTPAANPLEAAIMKLGYTEEEASLALRSFYADIPSQFQYVFDIVATGSSTQAFPLTKRFIVKDPTTSSNAAVDDFYALVDAAKLSKNPALESFVNARASSVSNLLHNAKLYPENAKTYIVGATDFIIATFALIAENPSVYGIKKFGPHSWRPSGNYEELAP